MTDKILFIEIFQPFAQYRNPFTFYYAQTYPLPPKSTVIGMLQNAVSDWYGHQYGIEKWWNLKISIHGGFENVFWNYQNLIKGEISLSSSGGLFNRNEGKLGKSTWLPLYGKGLKSQRSPVFQQELFNGHLFIFVKGEENILDKIKESTEKPTKILYLGRGEDVVFIRKVKEIEKSKVEKIKADVKLLYPTYILNDVPIKTKKYPVYSIPTKIIFKNNGVPIKHKAEITKKTEREVEFKTVIYTGYDYNLLVNKEIDVEFYTVDDKEIRILFPSGWL